MMMPSFSSLVSSPYNLPHHHCKLQDADAFDKKKSDSPAAKHDIECAMKAEDVHIEIHC